MPALFSEIEITTSLRENNRAAFNYIFDEYYAALVFYAQRYSLLQPEAEDLVMEVFTRFWQHNKEFDSLNAIKAYLYTSTRNASYNFIRDAKRRAIREEGIPELSVDTSKEDTDFEIMRAEIVRAVYTEIANLPPKCRSVFQLTYLEGLNTQQIAERLGISVSNVTSQRSNAVRLLKNAIIKKGVVLSWAAIVLFLRVKE